MRIAIIGAGVAGLTSALFLARDGHDVVLIERDATPLPESADAAFTWDRRGAAQVRHPHAFLARLRNLLRDQLPEVLEELVAAGASEVNWAEFAPETLDDRTPREGDEDLALIACRRTTFEWVLRRSALRTERVELRDGIKVTGLTTAGDGAVPRVTGVRTDAGTIDADLVVDAGGRHSAIRTLLGDIGVTFPEEKHDTDMAYLSRFYRMIEGAVEPTKQSFDGGAVGYLGYGVFRGDNRTFSVTIAVGTDDEELRGLIDGDRFDVAASLLPASQKWIAQSMSEPIAPMHVMAGTINRLRQLVVDGLPLVLGYVAVGDSLVCTNPLYGRGCSLGGVMSSMLAGAVREHGDDLAAIVLQLHAGVQKDVEPWYHASVAQDAAARQARQGDDAFSGAASILTEGLLPLTRIDATVGRAFFRMMNLLSPPDALFSDEALMAKVLAHWATRANRPPEPPLGPPREEMVAALTAALTAASV